jgi:hypothetical protein
MPGNLWLDAVLEAVPTPAWVVEGDEDVPEEQAVAVTARAMSMPAAARLRLGRYALGSRRSVGIDELITE